MTELTPLQKGLLHKLFAPDNLKRLVELVADSKESDWRDLYSALISTGQKLEATVFIDGASNPQSGTAGIGGIFFRNGDKEKELISFSENIGPATNNEAEYRALIRALDVGKDLSIQKLNVHSDSELLVKQINLEYKVKNERLRRLHRSARAKLSAFDWTVHHVPREQNKKADTLSKQALTAKV